MKLAVVSARLRWASPRSSCCSRARCPRRRTHPARESSSARCTAAAGTRARRTRTTSSSSTTRRLRRSPLTGWSVQYAATAGTTWQKTDLSGSIPAGGYYLVQEAQGAGGTTPLPTPNATGTIAMAAGAGKVVLLNTNTLTTCGHVCPSSRVDLVGYGTGTNCFEGVAPAPTISASTVRSAGGQRRDRHRQQRKRLHDRRAEPAELGRRSEPLDRRRVAERGQLGHDVVHVHGQPLRAGGRGRRHVRHRNGRRHCDLVVRLHGEVADGADDPDEQLDLLVHGPRQRRHDDGGRRVVLRERHERDRRDGRRRAGQRHDPGRRRGRLRAAVHADLRDPGQRAERGRHGHRRDRRRGRRRLRRTEPRAARLLPPGRDRATATPRPPTASSSSTTTTTA